MFKIPINKGFKMLLDDYKSYYQDNELYELDFISLIDTDTILDSIEYNNGIIRDDDLEYDF